MITRGDSVMIGKACPTSYTTSNDLTVGDVALFDQNKNIIKDEKGAIAASSVYVGVCDKKQTITLPNGTTASKSIISFSNEIQKGSKPSYVLGAYEAPVQDKIEIDLASATIVIGHRYVLRIVYKDLYEAPGQFTHTYEVIATSETAADLATAFEKAINKHANRRISVSRSTAKLTLTALAKDDNEGVNSLNEYSIVSMNASLYETIPGALLSNVPEKISGATITKTQGKAGKGYWKQVRDAEVRAMGYKGHVFTGAYPSVEQSRKVEEDATYNYMTIENDNNYLSCDNQYVKSTPLTTEVYVKGSSLVATSAFVKNLKAFITGVDTSAAAKA